MAVEILRDSTYPGLLLRLGILRILEPRKEFLISETTPYAVRLPLTTVKFSCKSEMEMLAKGLLHVSRQKLDFETKVGLSMLYMMLAVLQCKNT